MIRGGERIGQFILTAKTVAAVLRLAVYNISGNADGTRVLLDKRSVVSTHSIGGGYGGRYLVGAGVTAVNSMILINLGVCWAQDQRLVSVLLRPEGARDIFAERHDLPTLIIDAEDTGHTVPAGAALEGRSNRFIISNAAGRGSGTRGEGSGQHAGIALSRLTATR